MGLIPSHHFLFSFKTHISVTGYVCHICMSYFCFDLRLPLIIIEFDHVEPFPKQDPGTYFRCGLLCVFESRVTPVSGTLFLQQIAARVVN